ncbi:hypothetical protein F0919_17925 [Taibaiella lutea]|uniref:Uncharacterized protein n=1 Tax=Taibaiella lutea TaxID=2608001 RepID=A0A5M6CDX4_9BACT|nr:hypothetical protein [Taibaiella lutea]KAA5532660.1 hypothetical protein F0919_17925 [Taibaiella lutea]
MTLNEMAMAIPKEYRNQILEENMIYKSIASASDRHMRILFTLWTQYVDPHGENDLDCPMCVTNIFNNFKQLEPALIEIRKQEKILEEL